MSEERCELCKFWIPYSDGTKGQCRRYPPQIYVDVGGDAGGICSSAFEAFPDAYGEMWCGEFKEKENG